MSRIVVVGAGVAGLGCALFASRSGHQVVLVERDDTPMPADPHGAFDWDRRGAPQVRHSHAFLARLRNLLRDRHPDVLAVLLAAGATEMDFIDMLPEGMDQTRRAGDEDLVALACRRTTFEWVLRAMVMRDTDVEFRHGAALGGLRSTTAIDGVPVVDGITLDDGTELSADVVVLCGGRRQNVPELVAPLGAEVREEAEDTGIVYLSRFFELRDGLEYPPQVGPIGGDLGYLKYAVFAGDNRTFSITFALEAHDSELRRVVLDTDGFMNVARALPATSAHADPALALGLTGVEVMGGLLNRRRWFLDDDGAPVVLGLHAVGDAHTCTNPVYGRGCSLAMVQAQLLVDTLNELGSAHVERATAFESATEAEITPWYKASLAQDRMNRRATAQREPDHAHVELADPAVEVRPPIPRPPAPSTRSGPTTSSAPCCATACSRRCGSTRSS